ncbi:outer membrane protein assembly factor BamB family protein [Streptomyces sp. NPDC054813]
MPGRAHRARNGWYNGLHVSAADGRIYFTADVLCVLDAATTDLLTRVAVPSPAGAPLIHEGRVYVNSRTGTLYAISTETLNVVPPTWKSGADHRATCLPDP